MLGCQDPFLERLRRIVGLDLDFGATENFSGVELFGHEMNRAAADGVAGGKHAAMRVQPLILGKKGRVDVDDPAPPALDEPGRQDAHETGESNGAYLMILERAAERLVEFFPFDAFAVPGPGRQFSASCP